MAGTAREEAERLVATVLAMAGRSGLGGGAAHGAWATGSAECCVCPVCRVIASLRDPHPVTAERLATGAGDLATGLAGLMRAVSAMAGNARPANPQRPPAPPPNPDMAWSAATRTAGPAATPAQPPAPDVAAPATADNDATPAQPSVPDVWAAATRDRRAAGADNVDHDGTGA